jgi:hypothetical protein
MLEEGYASNGDVNTPIVLEEVVKIGSSLKLKKAIGIDNIPNEVLKQKAVAEALCVLFNKCFSISSIPTVWLKALIKPIPKGADKDPRVPLNYRGISLLSCVYKFYTAVLNARVIKYLEANNLLVEEQNGFRKGRSCLDHIYTLTSVLRNRLEQGLQTYAAFIDMQKAFDRIDRNLLLYKVLCFNIDGSMYKAIDSLYKRPLYSVLVNNSQTDWFRSLHGVRQGDNFSTTLFTMFINDLAVEIKRLGKGIRISDNLMISILLYADDIVLLAECEEDLQNMLDQVHSWCRKWRMEVNPTKTQIVHFRKPRSVITPIVFKVGDKALETVHQYKYLGVILNEHLDYNVTADILAGAAGRALGAILTKFKLLNNMGYNTYSRLYDSCVVPILDYAAGVWGYGRYKECDKVQMRAQRFYLGVHKFAPNCAVSGDMGYRTTLHRRKLEMIRLWNRVIKLQIYRIPKKILLWELALGNNNWTCDVQTVFEEVNKGDIFENQSICDMKEVDDKLLEIYRQEWKIEVLSKPKLRTYVLFKHEFGAEEYVKANLPRGQRAYLAQLRCGILPLFIETGRFKRRNGQAVPVHERICEFCDIGEVEDESHFMFRCTFYADLREEFFHQVLEKYPEFMQLNNNEKLTLCMTDLHRETAALVKNAFLFRRQHLYR